MSDAIYSPGLEGVIAGETAVSTVDAGLLYRGYAVEDLAEHATFEEVAYLLLWGNLPKSDELREFRKRLAVAAHVPDEIIATLRSIPPEAPMMDVDALGRQLVGALGSRGR